MIERRRPFPFCFLLHRVYGAHDFVHRVAASLQPAMHAYVVPLSNPPSPSTPPNDPFAWPKPKRTHWVNHELS